MELITDTEVERIITDVKRAQNLTELSSVRKSIESSLPPSLFDIPIFDCEWHPKTQEEGRDVARLFKIFDSVNSKLSALLSEVERSQA